MRREAQALVLLLTGGVLVRVAVDGSAPRYVRPGLAPLLLLTGVALVGLAGYSLWLAYVRDRPSPPSAGGAVAGPQERPVNGWPVLAVVLALVVTAPPVLGEWWAARASTSLAAVPGPVAAPLPPGDPVRLTIAEYAARAMTDRGASLAGRTVTLTGVVIAGPAGTPYLTRLVVGCCAAGARPVTVGLTGILPEHLTPGRWVDVDGTLSPRQDRDPVTLALVPYLDVTAVRAITPPAQPYDLVG